MTEKDPSYSDENLIWIDMEMTGLQPEVNGVLEVACIITDKNLNILHRGPVVAVRQDKSVLDSMDAWNTQTHTASGLVGRCLSDEAVGEEECAERFIEVFKRFVPPQKSPMCGNTIGQDRRFMARWLPRMEAYFHYRSIDVSTIKELARRWSPKDVWVGTNPNKHQALYDIEDSINELKHYRKSVMKI